MAIHTPAVNDYSFPSCHSYGSFASATVLFCYYKKWGISAFVLSVFIAFSRLYLFVHYPTDVAAGALLGIGTGIGAYFCVKFVITWLRRDKEQSKQLFLRALALYEGEYLAGEYLDDVSLRERDRLQLMAIKSAEKLSSLYVQQKEYEQAFSWIPALLCCGFQKK